ncbi:hypothetical protein K2173_010071 [Erythroxylum novogranatense]|uniref:Uncharacterized protein n=1 Tax=Erythroxylum novogranatense TaxID=1862640 RepID=A0AAV8SZN1_9ROSI|nr:hypothetical protein K2173_010071 [Erythroxylum novogranatense]
MDFPFLSKLSQFKLSTKVEAVEALGQEFRPQLQANNRSFEWTLKDHNNLLTW